MNIKGLKITSICFLLAIAGTAVATINDDWESGKVAFQAGDYTSALVYFEAARDAGLTGPAVYYNIAVSQFKLGEYAAARQTFVLTARRFPKMRGISEYNLGLIARRLENTGEAREYFLRAYELSPENRTIRVLASRRLRELVPEVRTASRWTGAFGVRAGYDDNIALRDELGLPVGAITESPTASAFASFSGPWNGDSGFRLEGSAYLIRYTDADAYDQSEFRGGVFYEWLPADWRLQFGVQASAGALGGDAFDRKTGARARAVRYINRDSAVDLRYTYEDINEANSLFAGIAGSRQRFDARYRWYRDAHRIQLRFLVETNDRLDPGVSPTRNRFAMNYGYQPERGFGLEAGVELRNSNYKDVVTPREEDLTTLRGALTYMFRGNWLVRFEYRNASNDSTDDTYSYDRSQFSLGALKYF